MTQEERDTLTVVQWANGGAGRVVHISRLYNSLHVSIQYLAEALFWHEGLDAFAEAAEWVREQNALQVTP